MPTDRAVASRAVVDVAVVQAGVSPRAAFDGRGIRVVATRRAAGCAACAVAGAAWQRRSRTSAWHGARRGDRSWRFDRCDLVSPHDQHARTAPLPRQGDDRTRIPRRAPAGVGRNGRASGTTGVSRSAVHAPQLSICARPYVRVVAFYARVYLAAGRNDGAFSINSPGAPPARGVRGSHRLDVDVAA